MRMNLEETKATYNWMKSLKDAMRRDREEVPEKVYESLLMLAERIINEYENENKEKTFRFTVQNNETHDIKVFNRKFLNNAYALQYFEAVLGDICTLLSIEEVENA